MKSNLYFNVILITTVLSWGTEIETLDVIENSKSLNQSTFQGTDRAFGWSLGKVASNHHLKTFMTEFLYIL